MTAIAVMISRDRSQERRVEDGSAEYHSLCEAGWDIDDIIGESEAESAQRLTDEARVAAIEAVRARAERIAAAAARLGMTSEVKWSSGASVYVTTNIYKVRISDHQACYPCDISVSPDEMSEDEAIAWLAARAAEDAEAE